MDTEEQDLAILEKIGDLVHDDLNEQSSSALLAALTVDECDRIIELFDEDELSGLPKETVNKLVAMLMKYRDAKAAGKV